MAGRLTRRPAPWPALVLDSEGLSAAARNKSEDLLAAIAATAAAGKQVLAPSVVLAETLYGDHKDASANRVLARVVIVPLDEATARRAAELKRAAGMTGIAATVDAIVVAVAEAAGGAAIATSDPKDIARLAASLGRVRVSTIRV